MNYWLYHGDCVEVMKTWPENSVDAVVCDPPYDLTAGSWNALPRTSGTGQKGFMNKTWDGTGVAFDPKTWAEVLRVLKPGGHLLSFGGTRTSHRMVCAIEDAGFEIRDSLHWFYGSGMIKSRNVARDIDRMQCVLPGRHYAENLPKGAKARPGDHRCPELPENAEKYGHIGTAVAPGHEPICFARKPMIGTVAKNVLQYGTGGLDVDGCLIGTTKEVPGTAGGKARHGGSTSGEMPARDADGDGFDPDTGRRPKNVLLSHADGCVCVGTRPVKQNGTIAPGTAAAKNDRSSPVALGDFGSRGAWKAHPGEMEAWECVEGCPVAELDRQSGITRSVASKRVHEAYEGESVTGFIRGRSSTANQRDDIGGASRFYKTFAPEAPFLYQAKPSRYERDFGCEQFPVKTAGEATDREDGTDGLKSPRAGAGRTRKIQVLDSIGQVLYPSASWVFEVLSRALPADMVLSLQKVTFGSTIRCSDGSVWSMCWCGSPSTDPSRPNIRSIIGTRTSWTTELKTWSASPRLHTNGCMADAFGVTAVGGSLVPFVR